MSEPFHPFDPAELLAQRAWMRRFAAALAGAEGEDLVQDAWVQALSSRAPVLARPRAWLASVLRNAARMRTRGALRREQREARVAREEALASTDELVAQAELEQLAVRAVLALSEPYRQALLLRYVRGLEPSEIARQLELPPSTVRNRIARGLAEVREELDRRHGRREAWMALLVPGAVVPSGATAAVVGGGIWMSAKWIAGAAALAAAAWLWVARTGREHALPAPGSSTTSSSELATPAPLAAQPLADPPQANAPQRQPLAPDDSSSARSPGTELLVHVTWARDGSPAANVPLRVESLSVEPFPLTTTLTTDATGTARFVTLPPGEQDVDTLRDASATVELDGRLTDNGEPQTLTLSIPLGLDVDCRVVDHAGAGVPGAELWLSDFGNTSSWIDVGRTGADGRILLCDLPGQHRVLAARADGHAPSTQREYRGLPGARIAVEFVLPGPGASLVGVVQDEHGAPLAGVELLLGGGLPGGLLRADGRFELHGLARGPLELEARAPGFGTARARVELAPDATTSCTLVLPREARVAGVARDGDGRPLAGVYIRGAAQYFDFSARETSTAADGSFVLRGLEAGRCLLGADGGTRGHARTELELVTGEDARWDLVLTAGGVVAGVVLDERGAPLAHWHVAAVDPADPGVWLRSTHSDAAGRFRIENCPTQPFELALCAPEEQYGDPVAVLADFHVGDESLILRALDACRPSSFLTGHLIAADGAPLIEVELLHEPVLSGGFGNTHVPDPDGHFRIGPLRSGEYTLYAEAVLAEHAAPHALRAPLRVTLQPGETKNLGDVLLDRCGWVHVRATARNGAPLPPDTLLPDLQLRADLSHPLSFTGLEARTDAIAPGTYLLHANPGPWRTPDTEVEIRPGETTELDLVFEPATN